MSILRNYLHQSHKLHACSLLIRFSFLWNFIHLSPLICLFQNMAKDDRRKVVPRVCIIGGKAAPGYEMAKKMIKLCHAVAEKINNDSDVGDLLKLVRGFSVTFILDILSLLLDQSSIR